MQHGAATDCCLALYKQQDEREGRKKDPMQKISRPQAINQPIEQERARKIGQIFPHNLPLNKAFITARKK